MDTPETLLAIVKEASSKHPADIDAAVKLAERHWRASEEFGGFVDSMVTAFIREAVHDVRHRDNTSLKRESGVYGQPAKIGLGTGAVSRVCDEWLDGYSINGVRLGDLLGESLHDVANAERNRAAGCAFNAKLCEKLAPLVPNDKTVRQAVSAAKVKRIVQEINGRTPKRKRELAVAG